METFEAVQRRLAGRKTKTTPHRNVADAGRLDLDGLTVECETDFATITVNSLDDKPIGRSRRLLLTGVGRAENTAQAFWPAPPNPKSWSPFMTWQIPAWGRSPVIVEPVRAKVTLKIPDEASVYVLDTTGKRAGDLVAENSNGTLAFDLAPAGSIWCEVVVE